MSVFVLDKDERDLINLSNNLTKEEIWEKLEEKSVAVFLKNNL